MKTVNERLKELRNAPELNKNGKMTMDRFGKRLGVHKSAISKIEAGENNVSDQMFKLICKEFNVNPEWLRDGTGPMFLEMTRNEQVASFINDVLRDKPDNFRLRLIAALSELDNEDWARIEAFARKLVDSQKDADDAAPDPIEEEVESYRQHLIAEKKAADVSSAFKESAG